MKKVLSGIVAMAVLLGLATNVKAATIVANEKVEKDSTVTVTVNVKETHSIGVWLKYDAEKFDYVEAKSGMELTEGVANGVVKVGGADTKATATKVTFTFKAKELTDASAFEVTRLVTENNETMDGSSISVKVVEKTPEQGKPSTDDEKQEEQKPSTDDKKEEVKNNGTKVNDEGKVIKKLPQTGVPYVAIAGLALAVVGCAAVARKMSK